MRPTGAKTIRLSAINIITEGRALAWDFSCTLFWRLMTGYRIPISLSCPCSRLEDRFGEHLEAACWMGSILAEPPMLQRVHSGHWHSATARREGPSRPWGQGGQKGSLSEGCSWEFYPCRDLLYSHFPAGRNGGRWSCAIINNAQYRSVDSELFSMVNLGKYSVGAAEVVYFQQFWRQLRTTVFSDLMVMALFSFVPVYRLPCLI